MIQTRNYYKPFTYPWAHDIWRKHEALHWSAQEVPLHDDVRDWQDKLTVSEKSLMTNLLRFFTQADVDVAAGYNKHFLPLFSGVPELCMMMNSFAAREAVHIDAYALLLETLGMPEETYNQFHSYKEMKDKHDFLDRFNVNSPSSILKAIAAYAGFTEGLQLFGSFVVLLNFSRFNKMKNMGNIVAWSIRDENLHVEGMTKLFRELAKDTYKLDNHPSLEHDIVKIAFKMVELEHNFIDLIYGPDTEICNLKKDDVKNYIRYLANIRWKQLGFNSDIYTILKNPLPWVDYMVNGEEHANFFESKSTFYSKAMTEGTMEDIKW